MKKRQNTSCWATSSQRSCPVQAFIDLSYAYFFASWSSVWAEEKSLQGLHTPTPFLQLSGTILRGRHNNLLGSELIFPDDKGLVLAFLLIGT